MPFILGLLVYSRIFIYSDERIERIPYEVLKTITHNFAESGKLGAGAFGCVYLGSLNDVNKAIKVLGSSAVDHFEREVTILTSDIRHPRLLSPEAVSIDEVPCLIYQHMSHGSLEDRLAMKVSEEVIACRMR